MTEEHSITLHLVSDATGETLSAIARATVAQFDHTHVTYRRWNLIRTATHLHRVLRGIEAAPGPVLASVMDRRLRADLDAACSRLGLRLVNVLDPVLTMLHDVLGEEVIGRPGSQYVLDTEYFRRIEAMDYVLAHDDGHATASLDAADVVLVGVSRASKTPTSFYLANRGIKAGNIPLIPDLPVPPELDGLARPVVGLTIDPRRLVDIRRNRLRLIAPGGDAAAIPPGLSERESSYVDLESVTREVQWARRLCRRHRWPVVDVTHRSIEETAAEIVEILDGWNDPAPPAPD
ncbi:MAG: kinase/pyrophosphorylase [Gluconacetobacter diazotrophicus]|nr:kinase/pyrophosphorylase [Gluconacetobacter diazotrophicus]